MPTAMLHVPLDFPDNAPVGRIAGFRGREWYAPEGAIVFNSYWGYVYRVDAINADGTITVTKVDHEMAPRWVDDHRMDGTRTHRTPLDKRDRVVEWPGVRELIRCG